MHMDALKIAGENALKRALDAWAQDIREPRDTTSINRFIQEEDALGWPKSQLRKGGVKFEWCGAFAAYAWGQSVKLELRKHYFASTYRLNRFAKYLSPPGKLKAIGKRGGQVERQWQDLRKGKLGDFVPRAGDILIVNGNKTWGNHICIVESYDAALGTFSTVEGNATGSSPTGERIKGVIKQVRAMKDCRWLYRPGSEDIHENLVG